MKFVDNHHYFNWCALLERLWRSRVAKNPKTQRAEESLAKFHAQHPDNVVSLAKLRIARGLRTARRT
jgi:hypothetical protein